MPNRWVADLPRVSDAIELNGCDGRPCSRGQVGAQLFEPRPFALVVLFGDVLPEVQLPQALQSPV